MLTAVPMTPIIRVQSSGPLIHGRKKAKIRFSTPLYHILDNISSPSNCFLFEGQCPEKNYLRAQNDTCAQKSAQCHNSIEPEKQYSPELSVRAVRARHIAAIKRSTPTTTLMVPTISL
jgi:hypothetical protein